MTAWLIEWPGPVYYGKVITGLGQTPEHLDAIRFAREEDAQTVADLLVERGGKAAEHEWIDG